MKAFRAVSVVVSLCLLAPASAEVRQLFSNTKGIGPLNPSYVIFDDVAIDGGYIIVLADNGSGKEAAFLYRRSNSTGSWGFLKTLLAVNATNVSIQVVMKNGIAAVRVGTRVWIFENSGGTYVPGATAAPLSHPGGLAISGNSLIVGGDGCTYDAVVYQKGADGNWGVTGRIDDHQGECHPEGLQVDLYYDYALVTVPHEDHASAWHRNGNAIDWVPAGTLNLPSGADAGTFPFVLERSTAASPNDYVFTRSGSTWTRTGQAVPVDYYDNNGLGGVRALYRGGILVSQRANANETDDLTPYLFQETTPGHFENVAMAYSSNGARIAISGQTMIVSGATLTHGGIWGPPYEIDIYELPTQLAAPTPVTDDFEDGRTSDFGFSGGQFALAKRGSNEVLAQSNPDGLALAVTNDSDDSKQDQVVEADITSGNTNAGSWVGLVSRYVDANNFYYLAVNNDLTFSLNKRVNGVDTQLSHSTWRRTGAVTHVKLIATGYGHFDSYINGDGRSVGDDTTFRQGRAGLATFQTRADFDNVFVSGTQPVYLLNKEFDYHPGGRAFTEEGGNWQQLKDAQQNDIGFAQTDPTVYALAHIGVPIENQEVDATLRVDSFDPSKTSGWVALLARYQDPNNYYYVAIRSTNQIQIRKVVDGVTSILAAAPFTAQPGVYHAFSFSVINDQLHLLVDGALVAVAHDGAFSSGQYGIGTYRATATWKLLAVGQP